MWWFQQWDTSFALKAIASNFTSLNPLPACRGIHISPMQLVIIRVSGWALGSSDRGFSNQFYYDCQQQPAPNFKKFT